MYPSKKIARTSGFIYLLLFVSGIVAEFFIRSNLIVQGNGEATANNIINSESLFRLGIAGDLIMIICDIALALLFYILLKPVNNTLALLAAFFRLAQAATLGINLLNLLFVLEILGGANYLSSFNTDQLNSLVSVFLGAHGNGYAIGLVFFGVSLLILGFLIIKAEYFPNLLGILLLIASIGYLADSFARFVLINYETYKTIFENISLIPAVIAELSLTFWLIIKGIKDKKSVLIRSS